MESSLLLENAVIAQSIVSPAPMQRIARFAVLDSSIHRDHAWINALMAHSTRMDHARSVTMPAPNALMPPLLHARLVLLTIYQWASQDVFLNALTELTFQPIVA